MKITSDIHELIDLLKKHNARLEERAEWDKTGSLYYDTKKAIDAYDLNHDNMMDKLLEDFKAWSGGSTPKECSEEEIESYLNSSLDISLNKDEVRKILKEEQ
jgi:hypothetical protein